MKTSYRFGYYFFGFALGCVMVWAMFYKDNDRRLSTPQGRVLGFLENLDEIAITEKATCQLNCFEVGLNFMDKQLWKEASVDFSESETNKKPCPIYIITAVLPDERKVLMSIETCLNPCEGCDDEDKIATLRNVELIGNDKSCDCE